ncbi:retrovirus-related pol polyprotein from transposon TNT 1-94 [Tanacetum coccineum]
MGTTNSDFAVSMDWNKRDVGFCTGSTRILPTESQKNITNHLIAVTDSSAIDYDSADESSVCSTPLPPLKKLDGAEPGSGPNTIKSILRLKSIFKAKTLKGVIINEPSSAPARGNKSSSASKVNLAPAGKLKSVKIEDDPPLAICDIMKPIWYLDSGCSRHMTGVKSYLHIYVEQLGPKVVFGDDSTCTTEGYGSIKCYGIVFTKVAFVNGLKYNLISISQLHDAKYIVQFDEKIGTIFNSNKEVVMIAPRVRDVYVLKMTSSAQESCFFAKAFENLNWIWHKRLAHLNFKSTNDVSFIEPYESPEPVVLETKVSSDQNGQADQNDLNDQNDQSSQTNEILNGDQSEHSNHSNDENIIDNLPNTISIQISEHLSSPNVEDTSVHHTIPIPNPSLSIPSITSPAPQDRGPRDKHIELVNIIDFHSEEEPKKASEALQNLGWVDAMQEELN